MQNIEPVESDANPLDVRIALRLSGISYFLASLVGLSFAPVGYYLFRSAEFALFSGATCVAYLLCNSLSNIGWNRTARILFSAIMAVHYGGAANFVGPFVGIETLLIPISVAPLLIFAKSELRLMITSYILIALIVAVSETIIHSGRPILALNVQTREAAYYGNIISVLIVMFYLMFTYSRASISNYMKLQLERNKSDQMLRELLPSLIADQMIRGEKVVAKSHGECTVLFADLVGFTKLSETLSPIHLVELLNEIFSEIDRIAEQFGIEKIKTIGDCYMAAAGALIDENQPGDMALFGMGIVDIVKEYADRTGYPLAVRVGINTGQVISGLIGTKRRLFDVWGQTVNVAQMMEAHSERNRILVSESTHWRLRGRFVFSPREPVLTKSGHYVQAFFLEGLRAGGTGTTGSTTIQSLH